MRPSIFVAALSLGACQSAPAVEPSAVGERSAEPPQAEPPRAEPPQAEPEPQAAAPEPVADADPTAAPVPAPPSSEPGADAAVDTAAAAAKAATRVQAHRELPARLVERLKQDLPDHTAACDIMRRAPCAFECDIDGDDQRDEVVLVRDERRQRGIAVLWGKGGSELLGAGRRDLWWKTTEVPNIDGTPNDPPGRERVDANLDWLAAWELWPLAGKRGRGTFTGRVFTSKHRFGAPGALGDGLMLSSADAAVVVYRTERGWTQMHLGF